LQNFVERDEIMLELRRILGVNFLVFSSYLATVLAKRMSGEMNTSLGNGFSNNMMIKFNMFKHGITEFELIVEGDDSLVCYNGPIIDENYFTSLGFVIKMKYVMSINVASFCGQIYDPLTFVVITDPIKFVLNFPWLHMKFYNTVPNSYLMELLRGKALCALYQYAGCPIVQPYAVRILELTSTFSHRIDSGSDAYKRALYHEMQTKFADGIHPRPITLAVRELMAESFGIGINDQIVMESIFSTMELGVVFCPPLLQYCHPDCLDYYDRFVRMGGITKTIIDYDFRY